LRGLFFCVGDKSGDNISAKLISGYKKRRLVAVSFCILRIVIEQQLVR